MMQNFDPTMLLPALVAVSVFAAGLTVAWPWLAPNDMSRRLRETITGSARDRIKAREAQAAARAAQSENPGLRSKASEPLAKLVALFRISERLDDGDMVRSCSRRASAAVRQR